MLMNRNVNLKGIQYYLVDETGKRTAVVINLDDWGELWEDFYGRLVSESRKDETTTPWEVLKAEMESGDVQD